MNSKLIGSILIVAGTTIGGGMLAMPIISAGVGFRGISLVLILIWLAMCYTALLFVKIYKYNAPEDGLNTITYKYLGKTGSYITALCMLILMYALVSAYIAGGSDIIRTNIKIWGGYDLSPHYTALLFTFIFGGIVCLGTRLVDSFTKVIFSIKLLFLFVVILVLTPYVRQVNLMSLPVDSRLIFSSIPVIFTAFGFHVVIPSLVRYLEGDSKKLRVVFTIGSGLPLLVYLIWQWAVLGSIDNSVFLVILQENASLEGLLLAIRSISHSPVIKIAINIFAAAAILTSFLGVALALYDYIRDLAKKKPLIRHSYTAAVLTFLPPLLFALFYPKGFILALGYASISLVVLSLIMPVLMLIQAKKQAGESISVMMKVNFLGIGLLALGILGIQVAMAVGWIPVIG